ncbi:right-handed parallel beta-helix repeat-containing protein [Streptomyces sp. WMMC940]|uniref:right-handed parallel beta-helix repeat-containing protein n=1 Tax=Streptomyces sp. WMMC940 TaxID=3015153 RepID=UPI0022B60B36|nr:hypothetical protein [Streptomyces sp. WMMC940]MCZ7460253.1 hypothetical protein [Streptomyces sp. WMMC940]
MSEAEDTRAGTGALHRSMSEALSRHWKVAVLAAAGVITVTSATIHGGTPDAGASDAKPATAPVRDGMPEDDQDHSKDHDRDDRGDKGERGHRDKGSNEDGEEHDKRDAEDTGSERLDKQSVACDPNKLIAELVELNENTGGTLHLAKDCTYTLTANQDGNGLPRIVQPITIHGNGATIARAANADQFRIFQVSAGGDLRLRGLTLTRGKPDGDGGAINVNAAGRLDTDGVTFTDNSVADIGLDNGGAVFNAGITTLRNSVLTRNSAEFGSAIFNASGKLQITDTKITGNTAEGDGTVSNDGGTTKIGNSLISHNFGSGVENQAGLTEIDRTTISNNVDDGNGGGIDHENGGLHVRNSVIKGNAVIGDENGGGIILDDDAVIEDSEITGNTAVDGDGGGIATGEAGSEVAIRGTKIAGNQAPGDGRRGGGLFVEDGTTVNLTDTTVKKNLSDAPAGGIHNSGIVTANGKVRIIDNVPTNCTGSPNPVPSCFG